MDPLRRPLEYLKITLEPDRLGLGQFSNTLEPLGYEGLEAHPGALEVEDHSGVGMLVLW
jgi:hypothetical protein